MCYHKYSVGGILGSTVPPKLPIHQTTMYAFAELQQMKTLSSAATQNIPSEVFTFPVYKLTWYCPNCRTLPKFRQKGKSAQSARKSSTPSPALAMHAICICKSKPNASDKLVECHSSDCKYGKYFHLSCIGLRRMPNNGKTTWICASCKGKKQQ